MFQPKNFEDKKLIAEFMGCEVIETYSSPTYSDYSVKGQMVLDFRKKEFRTYGFEDKMMFDNMVFDTSFDWLMEVMGKIENMGYMTIIGYSGTWGHYCNIMYSTSNKEHQEMLANPNYTGTKACNNGASKLEVIYQSVIEFIKWYNKNKI